MILYYYIKMKTGPKSEILDNLNNIELIKKEYPTLGAKGLIKKYKWKISESSLRNKALRMKVKMNKNIISDNLSKRKITKEWKNKISKAKTKYIIDKKTEKNIIDLYDNKHYSLKEISKETNLYSKKISEILLNNNIELRNKKWTDKEITFLKNNYYDKDKDFLIKNLNNRTWNSILSQASNYFLIRNKRFVKEAVKKRNKKDNPMWNKDIKEKSRKNAMKEYRKHPEKTGNYHLRRNRITSLEKRIKYILKKNNIPFEFNKYIKTKKSYKFPDFLIKNKLIIEADGERFHTDKIKEIKRDLELMELGYEIIHFKGNDINNNIRWVEECILKKLKALNL
jgi:very-short-patch-repair endonuclease